MLANDAFLQRLGEGFDRVPRVLRALLAGQRDARPADGDDALRTGEAELVPLPSSTVGEVHLEHQRERGMRGRLRIVVETDGDVGDVAAIVPVTQTGAVSAVSAPTNQTDRLERALRRVTETTSPVDRLRCRIRRNRVLPGAQRRIAVPPGLDEVQLTDRAGAEQLPRLGVDDRAHALAADLENAVGLPRGLDHVRTFFEVLDHRLFDVDVLARLHGVDGDARVPVIRRGDDHGVDVRPRQHLTVIARGEDVVAPHLLRPFQSSVVDIRDGHQFRAGDAERRARVPHALPSRANQRDLDAVEG